MRMKFGLKIPIRIGIAAAAIVALAAYAATTARAQQGVLFNDTFDTVGGSSADVNIEIGTPRQSGAFVSQFGSVSYYQQLASWGGNNTLSGTALSNSLGAFVSVQQNFGGIFSQGGLTVEYDLNAGADAWGWMGVGQVAQEYYANGAYGAPGQPGVGQIVLYDTASGTSIYQVFRNDVVPPTATGNLPVSIADQVFHHYQAVFTDPTDNNPFDGQGETDVTYYIQDGLGAYQAIGSTQIFPDGGLPSAVVTLQALNALSQWDNLKVTGNVGAFANPWASSGGNWNETGNWTTGVPNAPGAVAAFLNKNGGGMVYVDAPTTVGSIVLAGGADYLTGYSLVPDGVNNYGITLDNSPNLSAATIDVVSGTNSIYVPLVLANSNLAITITPTSAPTAASPSLESLTLSGGLSAGGKNVTVTCPVNGNWWEFPAQRPAGTLTVDTAPVTGIGTLALNYVNVHIAGVSVEAEAVTGGSSFLFLEGGSLVRPGTATGPSVDVMKFDISGGSNFTAGTGTTVRTQVLTSADGTGVFTLDGGTIALVADPSMAAGQIGADLTPDGLNVPVAPLAHLYLGPNGGTIDTGAQWNGLNQVIENLGETAGPLMITSPGVLVIEHNNTYTSDTIITNRAMTYMAVLQPFSTGDVICTDHGKVVFEGGHGGGVVANNFSFDSRGDNGATAIEAPNGINFTGTITLAGGTPGDRTSYPDFLALWGQTVTFSGKMTGTNGVVIGNVASQPGADKQLGNILFTGTESNDYTGDTVVAGAFLGLGKDNSATNGLGYNTAVATSGNLILDQKAKGFAYASVVLLKPNQTSNNTVVTQAGSASQWTEFALNGNSTTVRGLTTDSNTGLDIVQNVQGLSTAVGYPFYSIATTAAELTIDTKLDTDDFIFSGYLVDAVWYPSAGATLAVRKIGPGTQEFRTNVTIGSVENYTGGTFVDEGTLIVSDIASFTPHGAITVEGTGTMIAGNLSTDQPISVLDSGTLNANSIVTDSLTIGGYGIGTGTPAPGAVPEPSTIVLLVLAGLGGLIAWRRK